VPNVKVKADPKIRTLETCCFFLFSVFSRWCGGRLFFISYFFRRIVAHLQPWPLLLHSLGRGKNTKKRKKKTSIQSYLSNPILVIP